jgi:phosphoribosylformimino-5-aminoimidazole carboxamide ribonucleotide (ProFAR) isomerase
MSLVIQIGIRKNDYGEWLVDAGCDELSVSWTAAQVEEPDRLEHVLSSLAKKIAEAILEEDKLP